MPKLRNDINTLGLSNLLGNLQFIQQLDNSAVNNQPLYIGTAYPGTTTSEAAWQIKQLSYDGNGNVSAVLFASGSADFIFVWNNRAGYSFS